MKIEEIQDIFFQECDEGLVQAEAGLLALQSGAQDDETINTIFRAVHSIKGGSGAFGFSALQHFTHHFETLLDQLRSGDHKLTPDLIGILLGAFDMLADHIGAIRGEKAVPDDADMLAKLEAIAAGEAMSDDPASPAQRNIAADLGFDIGAMIGALDEGSPADTPWEKGAETSIRLFVKPLRGALATGSEPLLLLRDLIELGAAIVSVDWANVPEISEFDPAEAYLSWHLDLPTNVARSQIEEIFEFVSDDCVLRFGDETASPNVEISSQKFPRGTGPGSIVIVEPGPKPAAPIAGDVPADQDVAIAAPHPVGVTPTIRVDLEKLDRLVNLVGELVITQAMLAQRLLNCGLAQIAELTDLDHLTRELQDSAMSIRAQPIRSVFNRVPRIVRELQISTGKQVRLAIEGEATELDKTVVERIGEPLTHLIRNAIDHGLELPEERIAAGKTPEGRIKLSAEHRSGRILICVSDDGRGINRDRVLAKAVERGLVAPDAKLSDEEIDNLLFTAGFSTAETVSNISGRGVGMDVVRRNVQELGGRISISSRPGEGSTFTLALPLTLAVLDGMIVSVGDQTFVIPLTHIVESLRPQPEAVRKMGVRQSMINIRGVWLPILSVGDSLGIRNSRINASEAVLIVVESAVAGQGVLMVDEIVDQRQVVIKSLETNYGVVDDVAGATILGDGRVALILDVEAITSKHPANLSFAS